MIDTPFVAWILSVFLFLTLIIIFSLTTCFVKRSYLKQLSRDQQSPVVTKNNHFQTPHIKRAAFVIQIGFLEVCAALVVVTESSAIIWYDVIRDQPWKRCTGPYQSSDRLRYLSWAIVGCLFLSIVRCLAQGYVLRRLSMSDVVSMTRVYLIPSTCFMTAVCIWSWFHLNGDHEKDQSDKTVCCHVSPNIPLKSFLLILLPIFWNLAIDYSDYRREKHGFAVGSQSPAKNNLNYDSISVKKTSLVSGVACSQTFSSHTFPETIGFRSSNDKEVAETKPEVSTTIALPAVMPTTSEGPRHDEFINRKAVSCVFDSHCDFLHMHTRIYVALVLYLASLISAYTFMASFHAPTGVKDFTTVMYLAMLVITGMLRAMQVTVAEAVDRDGLKRGKVNQVDVIDV